MLSEMALYALSAQYQVHTFRSTMSFKVHSRHVVIIIITRLQLVKGVHVLVELIITPDKLAIL